MNLTKDQKRVLATISAGKRLTNLGRDWLDVMRLQDMGLVELAPASNGQLEIKGATAQGRKVLAERPLTDAMCVALIRARDFGLGSWDCGSGTLGALKKAGLVTNLATRVNNEGLTVPAANETKYRPTEEGLRRLAESGGR